MNGILLTSTARDAPPSVRFRLLAILDFLVCMALSQVLRLVLDPSDIPFRLL